MLKAILFDKDGTLFSFTDTWGAWCERFFAALSPNDAALQQQLALAVGYDMDNRNFMSGSPIVNASADETSRILSGLLPEYSIEKIEAVGLDVLHDLPLSPVTDLASLFTVLTGSGLKLGLATNDYESVAIEHLTKLAIIEQFDFICGFDSGFGSKPSPGMIHAFCDSIALSPAEVAMVGDSTHDLKAGRAAGVGLTVGVLTGPAKREDLLSDADAILPDISTLPEFLRQHNHV